jgi:hypothetical protein
MLFGAFHPKQEDERFIFALMSVLTLLILTNVGLFFGVAYEKSFYDVEEHFPVGNFYAGSCAVVVGCCLATIIHSGAAPPLRYLAVEVFGALLFYLGIYALLLLLYSRSSISGSPFMIIVLLGLVFGGFGLYNRSRSEIRFPSAKSA